LKEHIYILFEKAVDELERKFTLMRTEIIPKNMMKHWNTSAHITAFIPPWK